MRAPGSALGAARGRASRKAISAIEGRLAWRTEPGWACRRFLMLRNNDHKNAISKLHDISLTRRMLSEKNRKVNMNDDVLANSIEQVRGVRSRKAGRVIPPAAGPARATRRPSPPQSCSRARLKD